jgi:predicted enzyme related to lactoylglutathione lyase
MPVLSQVRVRVHDTERAARFFGSVFGSVFAWEFPLSRPQLVFTGDQDEPPVRLGFAVSGLGEAAARAERLGGAIEQSGTSVVRCRDSQGTPLWLYDGDHDSPGPADPASPQARGSLGVIFIFAEHPELAARFYRSFAGWTFEPIGRDKDILFATDGPAIGIRPAGKAPDGAGGAVTFHVSVADPEPVISAIQASDGEVGPPIGAGIFTTRACRDDQGTLFSLWHSDT